MKSAIVSVVRLGVRSAYAAFGKVYPLLCGTLLNLSLVLDEMSFSAYNCIIVPYAIVGNRLTAEQGRKVSYE